VSTISEIEAAIEKLPVRQVDQLADWLREFRQRRAPAPSLESWLGKAKGAAIPGTRTQEVMKLSRGEE